LIGFVDADEIVVPHAAGDLVAMLRPCAAEARCAGLRFNVRVTSGYGIAATNSGLTPLQASNYDLGHFVAVVKSFIKPGHHLRFRTPHATFVTPKKKVCLMDEYMACPPRTQESVPFIRDPPSADRAFVLHLHCSTLLDWVWKKSIVGRVDTKRDGNPCSTCYGSLPLIAEEFIHECGDTNLHWFDIMSNFTTNSSELEYGRGIDNAAEVAVRAQETRLMMREKERWRFHKNCERRFFKKARVEDSNVSADMNFVGDSFPHVSDARGANIKLARSHLKLATMREATKTNATAKETFAVSVYNFLRLVDARVALQPPIHGIRNHTPTLLDIPKV